MREIKFRGLRLDNGQWIYGCLVIRNCDGYKNYYIYDNSWDETEIEEYCNEADCMNPKELKDLFIKVDPETIGQYTELKDKNGKEIYEGDIIQLNNPFRFISSKSKLKEVIFNDGAFYLKAIDKVDTDLRLRQDNIKINHLIIIGNIYQDTEFLK